jgi:hypothetical protein
MCRHSPCVAVRWRRVIDALRVDGDAGPPERYPSVSRAALVPPRIRHAALFRKAIHHLQPDAAHTKLAWFEGIDWSRRTALGSTMKPCGRQVGLHGICEKQARIRSKRASRKGFSPVCHTRLGVSHCRCPASLIDRGIRNSLPFPPAFAIASPSP